MLWIRRYTIVPTLILNLTLTQTLGGGGNCPDTNLQLHSTIQIYFQRLTFLYSKIHIYIQRLTFLFNKFYSTELDNMVPKMSLSYKKIIQRGKS